MEIMLIQRQHQGLAQLGMGSIQILPGYETANVLQIGQQIIGDGSSVEAEGSLPGQPFVGGAQLIRGSYEMPQWPKMPRSGIDEHPSQARISPNHVLVEDEGIILVLIQWIATPAQLQSGQHQLHPFQHRSGR